MENSFLPNTVSDAARTRAAKLLSRFTDEERGYLIATTNIFSDTPYNVVGRPSSSNQRQNTVVFNSEMSISHSTFSTLTGGTNWDLHVCSLPFVTSSTMASCNDNGFTVGSGPAGLPPVSTPAVAKFGGLTFSASDAGQGTFLADAFSLDRIRSINLDEFLYPNLSTTTVPAQRTFYEVLSIGFEAINVTPTLYKGGSLIRYRQPTQNRLTPLRFYVNASGPTNATLARHFVHCMPMPPTTPSYANQYVDSVVDDAEAGTYSMNLIQDSDSDFHLAGNDQWFMYNSGEYGTGDPFYGTMWCSGSLVDATYDDDPPGVNGDFDMTGVYFTGLAPEAVITLKYRVVVSMVPASTTSLYASLAKSTPPYNPKLDELISLIQDNFPPGVPYDMNPHGEWWNHVLDTVSLLAPSLGSMFGPAGAAAGDIASIAARTAKQVNQNRIKAREEKKAKKTLIPLPNPPPVKPVAKTLAKAAPSPVPKGKK